MLPKDKAAEKISKTTANEKKYSDRLNIYSSTAIDYAVEGLTQQDSPITLVAFMQTPLEIVKNIMPKIGPKVTWINLGGTSDEVTKYIMEFIGSNANSIDGVEFVGLKPLGIKNALANLTAEKSVVYWVEFSDVEWLDEYNNLFVKAEKLEKIGLKNFKQFDRLAKELPGNVKEIRLYDVFIMKSVIDYLKKHKTIANVKNIEIAYSITGWDSQYALQNIKEQVGNDCSITFSIANHIIRQEQDLRSSCNSSEQSNLRTAQVPALTVPASAQKPAANSLLLKSANVQPPKLPLPALPQMQTQLRQQGYPHSSIIAADPNAAVKWTKEISSAQSPAPSTPASAKGQSVAVVPQPTFVAATESGKQLQEADSVAAIERQINESREKLIRLQQQGNEIQKQYAEQMAALQSSISETIKTIDSLRARLPVKLINVTKRTNSETENQDRGAATLPVVIRSPADELRDSKKARTEKPDVETSIVPNKNPNEGRQSELPKDISQNEFGSMRPRGI